MKIENQLMIFGWCGLGVMLASAIFISFFISLAAPMVESNPNMDINLALFHGKLIDVYPFALLCFPIALFPFAVFFFAFVKADHIRKEKKKLADTPSKEESKK